MVRCSNQLSTSPPSLTNRSKKPPLLRIIHTSQCVQLIMWTESAGCSTYDTKLDSPIFLSACLALCYSLDMQLWFPSNANSILQPTECHVCMCTHLQCFEKLFWNGIFFLLGWLSGGCCISWNTHMLAHTHTLTHTNTHTHIHTDTPTHARAIFKQSSCKKTNERIFYRLDWF